MTKFDTINVIPFVDIMLVLLAIVLTTATFVTNGQLDITLPGANAETPDTAISKVEIAIDRQNLWFLDSLPVDLPELQKQLSMTSPDTQVLLKIDESVEFSEFVSLIGVLKENSLDNVSIETRKTP